MKQFIARELRKAERRFGALRVSLVIATSGTAAALTQASQAMRKTSGKNGRAGRRLLAETRNVRRLTTKLTRMTSAQRSSIPGIGPKRTESWSPRPRLFRAAGALRSARVYLLRARVARRHPGPDAGGTGRQDYGPPSVRAGALAGRVATCKRYGVDPRQADAYGSRTATLPRYEAVQIYLRVRTLAGSSLNDARCGQVHELPGGPWPRAVHYCQSELFGYAPQRAICRRLPATWGISSGRSGPYHAFYPPGGFTRVQRAVVLLRLAVALNQDRASDVLKVTLHVYPKRVLMESSPGRTGAELELWSLRKEADYFREVFRRELFAALA